MCDKNYWKRVKKYKLYIMEKLFNNIKFFHHEKQKKIIISEYKFEKKRYNKISI